MNDKKLRVGFISNCPVGGKTGLGRNVKALMLIVSFYFRYQSFTSHII